MQGALFEEPKPKNQSHLNLLPYDGEVYINEGFFSVEESDRFFENLIGTIKWQQDQIKFYGKAVNLPRLTAWYGEHHADYSYSGINMKSHPWTPELLDIKSRIEEQTQMHFTSVLLNYYRDGNDYVGWHRDNEKVLRINPVIASVSFGATRIFRFRHFTDKIIRSAELTHGTYVLMRGETQHKWEHQIPKTTKVLSPRISLTFRILW